MDEITALWTGWIQFLETHGFDVRAGLEPAATDAEIGELESATGLRLNEAIISFYRQANGQKPIAWHLKNTSDNGRKATHLFGFYGFLGTKRAAEQWAIWKDLGESEGPNFMTDMADDVDVKQPGLVKKEYWIKEWLPFALDGGGNCLAFDFSPESQGTSGQVIIIGPDEDCRRVLAPNILELFRQMLDAANTGRVVIADGFCDIPSIFA